MVEDDFVNWYLNFEEEGTRLEPDVLAKFPRGCKKKKLPKNELPTNFSDLIITFETCAAES